MNYTALYRKFRPVVFDDVKGQDHIVTTLQNQIASGRIGHAYLFCGTRGTGKTTIAKVFAKTVNCASPVDGNPCGKCQSCLEIQNGNALDVIEIDAASNNGVDNVRQIRDEVEYPPTVGKYKIYIIDEVHMLSTGAFNALLKTLEEPPKHLIFILATTEMAKIPVTILSRCQRFEFRRIPVNTIADRLEEILTKEGVRAEAEALRYLAVSADGSMRDGLSLLDQCMSGNDTGCITYEAVLSLLGTVDSQEYLKLIQCVAKGDAAAALQTLNTLIGEGKEVSRIVNDLLWYLRNLMLIKAAADPTGIVDLSKEEIEKCKTAGESISEDTIVRYIHVLSELNAQLRTASWKRVLVETAMIRLCRPQMDTDDISLKERIRVLEEKAEAAALAPVQTVYVQKENTNKAPEPVKKVKRATPQELEKIVKQWSTIVSEMDNMEQLFLKRAVPKYSNDPSDPALYLEFSDENSSQIAQRCAYAEKIDKLAEAHGFGSVNIQITVRGKHNQELNSFDLYKKVSEKINGTIEKKD